MPDPITYILSTDLPDGNVHSGKLKLALEASILAGKFLDISEERHRTNQSHVAKVHLFFSDDLTQAEQDALGMPPSPGAETVMGDHDSTPPTTVLQHMTVSLLSGRKIAVAAVDPIWEFIGSTVGRVGFTVGDINRAIAHLTMAIKVSGNGTGAKVRLVEDDGTSQVTIIEKALPVTTGFKPHEFSTTPGVDPVPRNTANEYRLEASLNTADDAEVSLEIRAADLTVLEVVDL